ncbi:MAG: transporter substrate-binding domain-containing protein [Bacilli bacterium]|nr:transporter substrate-binding domain-containing protein [Bacilli bacterium]
MKLTKTIAATALMAGSLILAACGNQAEKITVIDSIECLRLKHTVQLRKIRCALAEVTGIDKKHPIIAGCSTDRVDKGSALKATFDTYLEEMEKDGSLDTLISSYFDGTATFTYQNPTVTATPKAGDSKYLVVGTNAYFPPFEYYEGSSFKGVDIEIASIFATKLDKTLYIVDMDFDALIGAVSVSKEVDVVMAGMTVSETRLQQVDFTKEYYESAQVISVKAGDTTFDNCKTAEDVEAILNEQTSSYQIGTQNGTTGYMYSAGDEDFGYDGFKNLTTKGYTTGSLAMQDLANGKINAVVLDKQPSLMIAKAMNS